MRFWGSGLIGSIIDGVVLGGILAVVLVAWRGPLQLFPKKHDEKANQKPNSRKDRKLRSVMKASAAHRRTSFSDYLQAWAMLAVIIASASYAIAGGHGEYGILTGIQAAFRTVSNPLQLALMTFLNVLTFAAMGAVLWTVIWGLGLIPLRLFYPSWAKASRLYHGTLFGIALGILIGIATTLNYAIAGKIVGPIDLLFK